MELVLVGLPGSGKSAVGRRLAALRNAEFVDLDALVETRARRPVAAIFEEEGEARFRAHETAAVAALGPADRGHRLTRVIATGGGAVIEPSNRWHLYRGRRLAWLDAPGEVLARRLTRSALPRPLLTGRDPVLTLTQLRTARERFYAAGTRVDASGRPEQLISRLEPLLRGSSPTGTLLLDARTAIGRIMLGDRSVVPALADALAELDARRAVIVSEPVAWQLHGERIATALRNARPDLVLDHLLVPRGERAKTFAVLQRLVRELASRRHERRDPVIAIGGGALGDVGGLAAAVYLRGVPLIHVPTTLLAQIDSSIGGKTAIDLPEGKNLVGAFHQPAAIVLDLALLTTLPARERRAALGEAVKMAALGDERLFRLLETHGPGLAAGDAEAVESGALAELVERCAWAKVEVVTADEHEANRRLALNLGHSLAHALEGATGYRGLLHGEAVALGLRGAVAVGRALDVTSADRGARILALLDALGLGSSAPRVTEEAVRDHLAADKKIAGGQLRWVLPTDSGVAVRADVPESAVAAGLAAALKGVA